MKRVVCVCVCVLAGVGGGAEPVSVCVCLMQGCQPGEEQKARGVRGTVREGGSEMSRWPCGSSVTPWPLGGECTARTHAQTRMHTNTHTHTQCQRQSAAVDESCQRMNNMAMSEREQAGKHAQNIFFLPVI